MAVGHTGSMTYIYLISDEEHRRYLFITCHPDLSTVNSE